MSGFTQVAVVVKPKGLKGEMHVRVEDDFEQEVLQPGAVFLELTGQLIPHMVEEVNAGSGSMSVFSVKGIQTKEQAEAMRKVAVFISEQQANEFRIEEEGLVGYEVLEDKKEIGKVISIIENSIQELLEVAPVSGGEPLLIPYVEAFITSIDHDEKGLNLHCPKVCLTLTTSILLLLIAAPMVVIGQAIKINGVNLVGERSLPESEVFEELDTIGVNTIALNPYAFCSKDKPELRFGSSWQWEGETPEGAAHQIELAKERGMQVIVKPHVWIAGSGWAGDLELPTTENWHRFHRSYRDYILHYAKLSDSLGVEILCIGTELKTSVEQDPGFWRQLIVDVRRVYRGKVTFAANWDNYQNIPFWKDLDFISVDTYFPCDTSQTANQQSVETCLAQAAAELKYFAKKQRKKVLFTEYGYRSIHRGCGPNWLLPVVERGAHNDINFYNQVIGYKAFYKTFWAQDWVLGGCLWKWYPDLDRNGENNDWTPQGKPALKVVKAWYKAFNEPASKRN